MSASQGFVFSYNLNEFCTRVESFTAYLTSQVLWKTSQNTAFAFLCLVAAWTALSCLHLHSYQEMWSSGFVAIKRYITTGQTSQVAKPLPHHITSQHYQR